MLEIRFHGRGGQGVKLASRMLGRSGFLAGLQAQDFALFGAERRGAPVVSFTRLDVEPIRLRGPIDQPNLVVVMDESLLNEAREQVFLGIHPRTPVFVNAQPNHLRLNPRDLPEADYVYIDISSIAREMVGNTFISATAAALAAKCIPAIAATALDEAVKTELTAFGLPAELIDRNIRASREAYDRMPRVDLQPGSKTLRTVATTFESPLHLGPAGVVGPTIRFAGSAALRETGNWRTDRPEIELAKCKRCFLCYLYCPEAAITLDPENFPHIDYDHCKGCMICYQECPTNAVSRTLEV